MHRTPYKREGPRESPSCRLAAVGDLMLSGDGARRHRPDLGPIGMPDEVGPILRSGDLVFGSLETPLCGPRVECALFRRHTAMAPVLWLVVHLRKGLWRELESNLPRARPEHVGMLARFAAKKLESLWRRH